MRANILLIFVALVLCAVPFAVAVTGAPDSPTITVSSVRVLETSANVTWGTSAAASSTFSIGNDIFVMGKGTEFNLLLDDLQPGTSYSYLIEACAKSCSTQLGSFKTTGAGPALSPEGRITGRAIAAQPVSTLQGAQSFVGLLYLAIIGILAAVVLLNAGYHSVEHLPAPKGTKMRVLGERAERLLDEGKHEEAIGVYKKMLDIHPKLGKTSKAEHHQKISSIYHRLDLYRRAKEANRLAEKYSRGQITEKELSRLKELLTMQ